MLFLDPSEISAPIPRSDERVKHILKVLKKAPGDELAAGTPDGMLGTARIESYDGDAMLFSFRPEREAPKLRPITLLLGFPRPIQASRILKDLASLGVGRIILSGTELGEKSYFQSDFFKNREFRAALIEGAEQAANPRLPEVDTAWTLSRALDKLDALESLDSRWAFDPYRAETAFGSVPLHCTPGQDSLALAIGSERGWTPAELDLLANRGFSFATLGDRILKTETATITAVAVTLSKLGYI